MARILIIEDIATNLHLTMIMLRLAGHEAIPAPDGTTGLRLAHEQRPDLIVCDVLLPDIDGREIVGNLKVDPALAHILVVAVTAQAMVGDRQRMLSAGFDGYISKPIEAKTFVRQLECFLTAPPLPSFIEAPPVERALNS